MVLEFSWLDCFMPSKDLWPAVVRASEGLYRAQVPCKPFTRGLFAPSVIGMWKFANPPQNEMLKGKDAVGEQEGAQWHRWGRTKAGRCCRAFQSHSKEVSLFWCIC